jgi:hypothetical protein
MLKYYKAAFDRVSADEQLNQKVKNRTESKQISKKYFNRPVAAVICFALTLIIVFSFTLYLTKPNNRYKVMKNSSANLYPAEVFNSLDNLKSISRKILYCEVINKTYNLGLYFEDGSLMSNEPSTVYQLNILKDYSGSQKQGDKFFIRGWGGTFDQKEWDEYWEQRKIENNESFSSLSEEKPVIKDGKVTVVPHKTQKILEVGDKAIIFIVGTDVQSDSLDDINGLLAIDVFDETIIHGTSDGKFVDERINDGNSFTIEHFEKLLQD